MVSVAETGAPEGGVIVIVKGELGLTLIFPEVVKNCLA